MTLIKQDVNNIKTSAKVEWPAQLQTPAQLMQCVRNKTKTCIVKSPVCSKLVLQLVGGLNHLLINVLNRTRVFNKEAFNHELRLIERNHYQTSQAGQPYSPTTARKSSPLLTYSNHISCIDDPVLWASVFPLSYYTTRTDAIRWSAAAVEICFSKPWHSTFFSLGKTFPIVRGIGLDQPAMKFSLALLNHNQWLHLFPEGRVMRDDKQQKLSNKDKGYTFKWGISKLILDYFNNSSDRLLRILPFYHLGMDEVLPVGRPYVPRVGKRITVYVKPTAIEMDSQLLKAILNRDNGRMGVKATKSLTCDSVKMIKLTQYLEEQMETLIEPANKLHRE